jgi:hypothetical protein
VQAGDHPGLTLGDPGPELADHRVVAVDERHCAHSLALEGGRMQSGRVLHRGGQGLLADDVLAGFQRFQRDRQVGVVRRTDVDHIDVRGKQLVEVGETALGSGGLRGSFGPCG